MPKYQKYVNALFIVGGLLMWLISQHYLGVLMGHFQLGRKIGGATEWIQIFVPIIVALATFAILRQNRKSFEFTSDSIAELSRVAWPSAREVRFGTIVVIITVILASIILGALDLGLTSIVKAILGA